jgi:ribonuclease PH
MDGKLTKEEFEKAFLMAVGGCEKVYELQKNALVERLNRQTKTVEA